MVLKGKWQKIATLMMKHENLEAVRTMFANKKETTWFSSLEVFMWHNFCMIGLRPFNLRAGCR